MGSKLSPKIGDVSAAAGINITKTNKMKNKDRWNTQRKKENGKIRKI